MKNLIPILIILQSFGCYNKYGAALQEEKSNTIPSILLLFKIVINIIFSLITSIFLIISKEFNDKEKSLINFVFIVFFVVVFKKIP